MIEGLDELAGVFQALAERLSPAQRKRVADKIARRLRHLTSDRIKRNVDPDGSAFEPRRPAPGRLRSRKGFVAAKGPMFRRLHKLKNIDMEATPDEASVGFSGGNVAVARVSQLGLRARIGRGREARYPIRRLLGFAGSDEAEILNAMMAHLAKLDG